MTINVSRLRRSIKRFFKRTKRAFLKLGTGVKRAAQSERTRAAADAAKNAARGGLKAFLRAGYLGVTGLIRRVGALPRRTQMVGGSVAAFLLLSCMVLLIAVPPVSAGAEVARTTFDPSVQFMATPGPPDTSDPGTTETPQETEETAAPVPAEQFETVGAGDTGPSIADIQLRLMALGYMDSDEPTEYFGSMTEDAVKTFQKHNSLSPDGLCGSETYVLLMSGDARVYVMQSGDKGDDVEGIQQRLYELGYLAKSNIVGTFGEKTETAVKEFQRKNDLKPVDGKVGNITLEALYGEDAVANAYTYGDKGDTILYYQKKLKNLGYIMFTPDGEMGRQTVNAIKDFQQANGIVKDGSLGPQTRELLDSGDAQPKVIQLGDSGAEVETVQKRLIKLGYLSSSSATGYFGYKTEEAVKAFQKRNKLSVDGGVGRATLSALNSTSARKAPEATAVPTEKPTPTPKPGTTAKPTATPKPGTTPKPADTSNKTGVEKLIAIAQTKLGCKYVRGAKGPNSFDCSGFVYWCLNQAGIKVSYMTSITWRTSSRFQRITSMSSLKRGDVLVFSGSTMATGHVGIYLGDGKMIDAGSSAGQVRTTTTVMKSGGYWSKHFLMGYRVF